MSIADYNAGVSDGERSERDRIRKELEALGFEYRPRSESPHNVIAIVEGELVNNYQGDFDAICEQCRTEQAVAYHKNQIHWWCAFCDYKHLVPAEVIDPSA